MYKDNHLLGIYFLTGDLGKNKRNVKTRNATKCSSPVGIKVPKIYWQFTRKAVLTMEWVHGIKLTDETGLKKASLDRKELIDQVL